MDEINTSSQQSEIDLLVEGIRHGDPATESEFAARFHQRVFLMLVARLRDPEAARDLAQEVLMTALRALRNGQLREDQKLSAFVHGIARNLANNYFRAQSRRPREVAIQPDLPQPESASYEVEEAERSRLVRQALERLRAGDRQILLLTLVNGLKPGAIADRLGLTAEVVRARKSRALRRVIEEVGKVSRKISKRH